MKEFPVEVKLQGGYENQQEVLDGFNKFSEVLSKLPTDLYLKVSIDNKEDKLKVSLEDFYLDIVRGYFREIRTIEEIEKG